MEERLVVGETALRARDQVDDLGRVGRDHAGARVLLRPVLEVEADVRNRLEVEPQRANRLDADLDRALLRVRRLERRQPPQPGDMRARRHVGALRAEQPLEPALAQPRVLRGGGVRRRRSTPSSSRSEICFSASFRATASRSPESPPSRSSRAASSSRRCSLKPRVELPQARQLVALSVLREDGQLRLGRPQRELLAVERQPGRQHRVLERVLTGSDLGLDDAGLARSAQPVEALLLVSVRCLRLGRTERSSWSR